MKPSQNGSFVKQTKSPEQKRVNIIASKGADRVWCFNINFWLLWGIIAALILYLIFTFLLAVRFFGDFHQKNLLAQLENDFQTTQKALFQAKQRLKFLENYIDPSKIPSKNSTENSNAEAAPVPNKTTRDTKSSGESLSRRGNSGVEIKDMDVNLSGTRLSATFKLARSTPGRTPLRGYVFMLAVDRSIDPPRIWPSPKADMEKGMPVNPKKGQAFKIRNFRRIRARWSFSSPENTPSELRILVYDGSGVLLLTEDYSLKKDQQP